MNVKLHCELVSWMQHQLLCHENVSFKASVVTKNPMNTYIGWIRATWSIQQKGHTRDK